MRVRIWLSMGISFAVLLLLVPLFAWLISREASKINLRTREAHRSYQTADDAITEIRANIYAYRISSFACRKTREGRSLESFTMKSDRF